MQTKNMNIQKPVWEVPGKRNATPSAIAPMKEQVRKRHCSGSRHQSIENRRHEGRLSAAPLVCRREYQTVPSENSIVVTNTSVQKTTSGFVWLSRSGSILGIAGPYGEDDQYDVESGPHAPHRPNEN